MYDGIRNALLNGNVPMAFTTNAPRTANDQYQYYGEATKQFIMQNAQWASNLFTAKIQGMDYENFYEYTDVRIRAAQVIDPTTGQNLGDDWRRILIENTNLDFIPRGAKVVFNGNTWLVTNPDNIASVSGTAIIKRCNATWHHLDWYGNVLTEPFCYGQGSNDLATANNIKINMILLDAYQHCSMQLNPETRELAHNRRLLLGDQAYSVRGLQNFVQEIGDDINSVHMQFFDVSREETLSAIDDITNRVADGLGFTWEINLSGTAEMKVGSTQTLKAVSVRNGITLNTDSANAVHVKLTVNDAGLPEWLPVDGTETNGVVLHEVSYAWSSSDEEVATVDEDGVVTAVAAGAATITCRLQQNGSITKQMLLTVTEESTEPVLVWETEPPERAAQYQTITFKAVLMVDGEPSDEPVAYSFSGASERDYSVSIDGNTVTLTAYTLPKRPIAVQAECNGMTLNASIAFTGW